MAAYIGVPKVRGAKFRYSGVVGAASSGKRGVGGGTGGVEVLFGKQLSHIDPHNRTSPCAPHRGLQSCAWVRSMSLAATGS